MNATQKSYHTPPFSAGEVVYTPQGLWLRVESVRWHTDSKQWAIKFVGYEDECTINNLMTKREFFSRRVG